MPIWPSPSASPDDRARSRSRRSPRTRRCGGRGAACSASRGPSSAQRAAHSPETFRAPCSRLSTPGASSTPDDTSTPNGRTAGSPRPRSPASAHRPAQRPPRRASDAGRRPNPQTDPFHRDVGSGGVQQQRRPPATPRHRVGRVQRDGSTSGQPQRAHHSARLVAVQLNHRQPAPVPIVSGFRPSDTFTKTPTAITRPVAPR